MTTTMCERRENINNYERGERKKMIMQERRENDNDNKRERGKRKMTVTMGERGDSEYNDNAR